jgi:phosphomannomutase
MLVTLKLLGYISEQGKPASEIFAPFDRYFHSGEVNTHLPSRELASAKLEELKRRYADGKLNELDGISLEYPDYWFNVRASNTEPVLRLTVEARTKELMEQKRDEISAVIKG